MASAFKSCQGTGFTIHSDSGSNGRMLFPETPSDSLGKRCTFMLDADMTASPSDFLPACPKFCCRVRPLDAGTSLTAKLGGFQCRSKEICRGVRHADFRVDGLLGLLNARMLAQCGRD